MIIDHIYERTTVKPVSGPEYFPRPFRSGVVVCITINLSMQADALLDSRGIVKFLFSFYKITDHIAHEDTRVIKGQVCVREVIQAIKLHLAVLFYE